MKRPQSFGRAALLLVASVLSGCTPGTTNRQCLRHPVCGSFVVRDHMIARHYDGVLYSFDSGEYAWESIVTRAATWT